MSHQNHQTQTLAFRPATPRPGGETEAIDAILAALEEAVVLARRGDVQRARRRCAAVIFEQQPLIASRAILQRAAMHALLTAGAVILLSRVVMMLTGRHVAVVTPLECQGAMVPPSQCETYAGMTFALDTRWIAQVSREDAVFRAWCDAVLGRGERVTAPAARTDHLELA